MGAGAINGRNGLPLIAEPPPFAAQWFI